jgi:Tol biopolymer transport system component/DNA-binding winged helix-turn-helix (wHTH) protein
MQQGPSQHAVRYRFDGFEIDPTNRIVLRDGRPLSLTGKVFDILVVFAENPGRLLEKDELIERVWDGAFVEEGNLARNVSTLRKALGDNSKEHKYILTVQGRGYRFVADVLAEAADTRPSTPTLISGPGAVAVTRDGGRTELAFSASTGNLFSQESSPRRSSGSRQWLLLVVVLCLSGTAFIAYRYESFKPVRSAAFSFEKLRQIKLTQDGNVYIPHISADGQLLAYVRLMENRRALHVRHLSTGSVLELRPPQTGIAYWSMAFAPDNGFLYYILKEKDADYGKLFRISVLGGQSSELSRLASGALAVSPNGRQVAFTRIDRRSGTSSILVVDEDGSNERVVGSADLDSMFNSLDWSPDGENLLYSIKRQDTGRDYWYLAEISAAGGPEDRIGEASPTAIMAAKWLPGKNGLVVNAIDESSRNAQIYFISYPDGVKHRVTNDLNNYIGFSLTKDGKAIVVPQTNSNRHIWRLRPPETDEPVQISTGTERHFDSLSWSGNDQIVYSEDENSSFQNFNIYRIGHEGSGLQQLTADAGNNNEPAVSPDGGTVVFVSSRSGKSELWRMNIGGRDLIQLTDFPHKVIRPVFSPNGETVYFSASVAGRCHIWRISVNGGPASPVIEADVYRWAISPDGDRLAYSTFDEAAGKVKTFVHRLSTNRLDTVLDISPETWVEWSKDGKALYYNTEQDAAANIWLQSLNGSTPRRVTDFNKEYVFRFAWSPDGRHLAFIRQHTTFDALMLRVD